MTFLAQNMGMVHNDSSDGRWEVKSNTIELPPGSLMYSVGWYKFSGSRLD